MQKNLGSIPSLSFSQKDMKLNKYLKSERHIFIYVDTYSYGQYMICWCPCFKFILLIGNRAKPNDLHRKDFSLTFMKSKLHDFERCVVLAPER